MTDSSGDDDQQGGSPPEPQQVEEDMMVNGQEEDVKEEEKTLTDHLNKKLLSSFLSRLESGNFQFPSVQTQQQATENGEEEQEFEDS